VGQEAGQKQSVGPAVIGALDRDWDQHGQREDALNLILNVLQAVENWVQTLQPVEAELAELSLSIARQVKEQEGPRR
jgi:hypothetical protein